MSGPSSLPTVEVMGVCHGGERASYTSSIFHQTGPAQTPSHLCSLQSLQPSASTPAARQQRQSPMGP